MGYSWLGRPRWPSLRSGMEMACPAWAAEGQGPMLRKGQHLALEVPRASEPSAGRGGVRGGGITA